MRITPITRLSAGLAAALAAFATATSVAAAGGEPKNQAPFTRSVGTRALTQQLTASHLSVGLVITGEPKNQAPFTRR